VKDRFGEEQCSALKTVAKVVVFCQPWPVSSKFFPLSTFNKMTDMFPILRSERLLLRQFTANDLERVFKGLSHPEVIRYYGVEYADLESTQVQMDWFAELERTGTGIWWAVCSPDNAVFFGAGGLNNLNKTHRKAEVGFWLMPEYWGRGIMPEAMSLICDFGFVDLGLHRIEAQVETENISCKNALAKLRFQHEGTMRDCEIKHGKFISLDLYAKLSG